MKKYIILVATLLIPFISWANDNYGKCLLGWQQYLEHNPIGTMKEYSNKTTAAVDGRTIQMMEMIEREEVIENTDERLVLEKYKRFLYPMDREIRKEKIVLQDTFISRCIDALNRGLPEWPVDFPGGSYNMELLEQKEEIVTVAAGIFETTYYRYRSEIESRGVKVERFHNIWINKNKNYPLTVKIISNGPADTFVSELISFK